MAIPVVLITGFLGSGKTTLLNNLLRDSGMGDTAVIINEFGDVAIDHLLVESAIENAVVLQSGCICCTVRGDLVDTLDDLCAKVARGELPPFSRIAIETTGLADPASLVRAFLTERLLADRFTLRAVVTTVDAVNGAGQLDEFEEARHQAALADVVVLTKSDLASSEAVASLTARLRQANPSAAIVPVVHGAIAPDALFALVPAHPSRADDEVLAWLNSEAFEETDGHAQSHHDSRIKPFAVTLDRPVTREALRSWLRSILSLRGSDLLRMKGIVALKGEPAPVVVHAVQNALYPPVQLAAWPSDDHTTRIVFITRDMAPEALRNSLEVLASRSAA
jgi:G3E family GTPase